MIIELKVPLEIAAQGVFLLRADSEEAAEYMKDIAGSDLEQIRHLLGDSVVLVNGGQRKVMATMVGFSWTDAHGGTPSHDFGLSDFNSSTKQLAPGQGRFYFPERGLNVYFARQAEERMISGVAVMGRLAPFAELVARASAVVAQGHEMAVYVDSVVVAGVGIVGPDRRQMAGHGWNRTGL